MKKQLVVLVAAIALGSLALVPALAGESGPAGNSNVGHVYLYEKDPDTYDLRMDAAWGRMSYNLSGPEFAFVFNGHDLQAERGYTLLYFPTSYLDKIICLAHGQTNAEGDIHIQGSKDTGDLDGWIWLVWSEEVNCSTGNTAWNAKYLFSDTKIDFSDTDG